jgi:hypothetical protein
MEGRQSQQIAAHLSTFSVDEKLEAGRAIEGIEDHPGVRVLLDTLAGMRETAFFRLTHGNTEAVGKLNKDLGFVNGLEVLPDAIETIRAEAKLAQAHRDAAAEAADAERQEA